jgi:site-specific recombinase XerD
MGMKLFTRGKKKIFYIRFKRGVEESLRTSDENIAQGIFEKLEIAYLEGRLIRLEENELVSFHDFKERYLLTRTVAKNTLRADKLALSKFDNFYKGKMGAITAEKLEAYRPYLNKAGYKESSVNNFIAHLKVALRCAWRWKYIIDARVLEGLKISHVSFEKQVCVSAAELRALLAESQKVEDMKMVVPVMIYTGLSRIDAVGTVVITADNEIQYRRHKTKKLISIPIHPDLRPYIAHLEPGIHRLTSFRHPRTLGRKFFNIVADAEIKGLTPHKLRHTFATLLLEAGADIATVSELLGHASVSITMTFYGWILKGLKVKTINLFNIRKEG